MAPQFVTAKLDLDVEDIGTLFKGVEFCVLNGDGEVSKHDIETLVLRGGGSVVSKLQTQTEFVVVGDILPSHKSFVDNEAYSVIKPAWVVDSTFKDRQLPMWPKYVTRLSEKSQSRFSEVYDVFGNSYS